jgi:hypothetical protein
MDQRRGDDEADSLPTSRCRSVALVHLAAQFPGGPRRRGLDIRYRPTRGRIEMGAGPLLRLATTGWPEKIQVHLRTLADHGEPCDDEHIKQLVQELADTGVNLDSGGPRSRNLAPLEPLADDNTRQQFLTLMERVLDTLTTSS